MKKIFFTLRDFSKHGGGAIRINGLIDTLVTNNIDTTLICQPDQKSINSLIKKKEIDLHFSTNEKRLFYLLLSFGFTFFLTEVFFKKKLQQLTVFFKEKNLGSQNIIFCEYFDNSIAYYLKRKKLLESYSIDLHGVAHIEFSQTSGLSLIQKISQKAKYHLSIKLDKKVFSEAKSIIFASNSLREYIINIYPTISEKSYKIIPYLLSTSSKNKEISQSEIEAVRNNFSLEVNDRIVFFAGGFSKISGLFDLIDAFTIVLKKIPNAKLFLIGKGGIESQLKELTNTYNIEDNVIFAGTVAYEKLHIYQSIADVIVCPDTDNLYSNLVVHVKYFDSLSSGKTVINGSFPSVKEINHNENLSISFAPSDIHDLSQKIIFVLENLKTLEERYSKNRKNTHKLFHYNSYLNEIVGV